jgi:hypothetical protein
MGLASARANGEQEPTEGGIGTGIIIDGGDVSGNLLLQDSHSTTGLTIQTS